MTRARTLAVALGLTALAVVLVRTAWVCDDAYITFRAIDNLRHGYGLRYNVIERVQVFTHPLWMMVMTAASVITHDYYDTSMALGFLFTMLAAGLIALWVAKTLPGSVLTLTVLTLSKAFVDFSTSGLENALTYLLLAVFCGLSLGTSQERRLASLGLVAGLVTLNRLDAALLVAPSLLREVVVCRSVRGLAKVASGFLPLAAWLVFATFFFGFPLPNPAYAKLGTGLPQSILAAQGIHYLRNSLREDPLTLVAIAAGVVVSLSRRNPRASMIGAGTVLYILYVVRIGGDFMSGRFLTAPLLCAVAVLSRVDLGRSRLLKWLPVAAASIVGLATPEPTILSGRTFGQVRHSYDHGIADERAYYFQGTGLLRAGSSGEPTQELANDGRELRKKGVSVVVRPAVGMVGFFGGPDLYVLDFHAVVDPLLSHLPIMKGAGYRPGHFRRRIPAGYPESVADLRLAAYYARIRVVTRGPLWSSDRFLEIWRLNTGRYDGFLADYGEPPHLMVPLDRIEGKERSGARWDTPGVLPLTEGIDVWIGRRISNQRVELSLDGTSAYDVAFHDGTSELCRTRLPMPDPRSPTISTRELHVPAAASVRGFDRISIQPVDPTARCALGHLRFP